MTTITVPVTIEDTGFNRHDERHEFIKGAEGDTVSATILEHYEDIRNRFGGELEAVRAWLYDQNYSAPDADDIAEAANECYAGYLGDDLEDIARNDQEICGVSDMTHEYIEELLNDGDEFGELEEFTDSDTGEIDYGEADLNNRIEYLRNYTCPLPDPVTGKLYHFHI